MTNLLNMLEQYSIKEDREIKKICAPLANLGISYFWYYAIQEDGGFGFLTNDSHYVGHYYDSKLHLNVPYYAPPSYFRSGYAFGPSAFDDNYQTVKHGNFAMDHAFLILKAEEKKLEGFAFYNRNSNINCLPNYLQNLDLLEKFIGHFKRQASGLTKQLQNETFNIRHEMGDAFLRLDESVTLYKKDIRSQKFLKEIYGLSAQEMRCLELFKQGYSAQASASILNLSRRTVETYFNNIKNKLGCYSKSELLNF